MRRTTLSIRQALLIITAIVPLVVFAYYPPNRDLSKVEVSIDAYPNPTSSVVNVRIPEQGFQMLTLSLEDTKGKVLLKDKITHPGVHTVNMRLLSQGSYVLHLQSEDGSMDARKAIQKVAR